jgi:hypothetical protein
MITITNPLASLLRWPNGAVDPEANVGNGRWNFMGKNLRMWSPQNIAYLLNRKDDDKQ